MADPIKFDLGGRGPGRNGFKTVNLEPKCDLHADILALDSFCQDGSVDEFYLSHTLEHVPVVQYLDFLKGLYRKLKAGGRLRIVQTDILQVMAMILDGRIGFRAGRAAIFTQAPILRRWPLNQHHNGWSSEELAKDLRAVGFAAEVFDAGSWAFDATDDLYPQELAAAAGIRIPNLGVLGTKPDR